LRHGSKRADPLAFARRALAWTHSPESKRFSWIYSLKTKAPQCGERPQQRAQPKRIAEFLPIIQSQNRLIGEPKPSAPINELRWKDQWQFMEQPYFSVQKRKRIHPIEFESSDGLRAVRIEGIPSLGIATIWDADILIWAASIINDVRAKGGGNVSPTLRATPYDLLKAIGRDVSGKSYRELQAALSRLQSTSIFMSARSTDRLVKIGFNWIDEWRLDEDPCSGKPRGVAITLSDRVFQSILAENALLTVDPRYLSLSGGIERALYRVIRKHAGSQRSGWLCRLDLLRQKIGSESSPKEFGRIMRAIIKADKLPEYRINLVSTKSGQPALQCRLRGQAEHEESIAVRQEFLKRNLRNAERLHHAARVDRAMEAGRGREPVEDR
jgi:plasmid replication initiation protein